MWMRASIMCSTGTMNLFTHTYNQPRRGAYVTRDGIRLSGAELPARLRPMSLSRAICIWAMLDVAVLVVLVASLAMGSVALPVSRALGALLHAHTSSTPDIADDIVLTLRLPRALAGFASGALLALGGALLQVLLRNPLAEPYMLGVSGGAATFALTAMLLSMPWWGVDLAACAGAFASIVLVLGLVHCDI